jgi:outer membrane lipoprotein-sorting protein
MSNDRSVGPKWSRVFPFALLCLFLCAGCAKKGAVAARPGGLRTPAAMNLEREIRATIEATNTVKALAEIEVSMNDGDRRTEAVIVARRPSNLRIDMMDELADVLAKLGSDGGKLWLYVPDGGQLYVGASARRGLARMTGLSLSASELISVLLGVPPLVDDSIVLESGDGSSFTVNERAFRLWADESGKRLVGFERTSRRRGYRVDLSDYRRVGSAWFPYKIRVSVPRSATTLYITYRDLTGGTPIKGDPFSPPTM